MQRLHGRGGVPSTCNRMCWTTVILKERHGTGQRQRATSGGGKGSGGGDITSARALALALVLLPYISLKCLPWIYVFPWGGVSAVVPP